MCVFGQKEDLASKSLSISNRSDSTISFFLKNGNSAWTLFELGPDEDENYFTTTKIRVVTGNKSVEYDIEYGKRYELYWDKENQCWNVIMLSQ